MKGVQGSERRHLLILVDIGEEEPKSKEGEDAKERHNDHFKKTSSGAILEM